MVDKNRETAAAARNVKENAPKNGFALDNDEDEDDESAESALQVPRRLVFTHKENLLDCAASSSASSDPSLHTMAENVRDTIQQYKKLWKDDMEVAFLSDQDCREALNAVKPDLLQYYDDLPGMFKGDLCRAADLFSNGG